MLTKIFFMINIDYKYDLTTLQLECKLFKLQKKYKEAWHSGVIRNSIILSSQPSPNSLKYRNRRN